MTGNLQRASNADCRLGRVSERWSQKASSRAAKSGRAFMYDSVCHVHSEQRSKANSPSASTPSADSPIRTHLAQPRSPRSASNPRLPDSRYPTIAPSFEEMRNRIIGRSGDIDYGRQRGRPVSQPHNHPDIVPFLAGCGARSLNGSGIRDCPLRRDDPPSWCPRQGAGMIVTY